MMDEEYILLSKQVIIELSFWGSLFIALMTIWANWSLIMNTLASITNSWEAFGITVVVIVIVFLFLKEVWKLLVYTIPTTLIMTSFVTFLPQLGVQNVLLYGVIFSFITNIVWLYYIFRVVDEDRRTRPIQG